MSLITCILSRYESRVHSFFLFERVNFQVQHESSSVYLFVFSHSSCLLDSHRIHFRANAWIDSIVYISSKLFIIAFLIYFDKRYWNLLVLISIPFDYCLADYYSHFFSSRETYFLLHSVSPLTAINCVTLPSYYVQCIILMIIDQTNSWIRILLHGLLICINRTFIILFGTHPLLIIVLFLVLLDEGLKPPSTHYGPLSYVYANAYSEFLPSLQSIVQGITLIPLIVRIYSHPHNRFSDSSRYLPVLAYGDGPHSLAYSLLFLLMSNPSKVYLILCLHCFTISLYYDLCVEGSDIFAVLFYTESIACGFYLHEYISVLP